MTRWRAAGVHLLVSALVAAGVLALMLALWYPPPLFQAMGGAGLALIVTLIMNPEGVAGAQYKKKQQKKRRFAVRDAYAVEGVPPLPERTASR